LNHVRLIEIGLAEKLAHNIVQLRLRDEKYNTEAYLELCRQVFLAAELPESVVEKIVTEARKMAEIQYATAPQAFGHGGSSIHPAILFEREIGLLKAYLQKA